MAKKFKKDSMFFKNRHTILSLLVILGMYFIATSFYDPESVVRKGSAVVTGTGTPNIGGDFEVVNHKGETVNQTMLDGKYSLIFFGFTHCPDVCPTSLLTLSDVYAGLSDKQKSKVQIVLATVDPERDTVAVMKDYVQTFHSDFIGLTGTPEQMKNMAKKYLVYHVKRPSDDGYTMDHSGYIYFVGPDGRYVKHFRHEDKAADILKTVQSYVRK